MAEVALHKDPVFEDVLWDEVNEKRCLVCVRRMEFRLTGEVHCGEGKRWPQCLSDKKKGFQLDEDK